MADFLPKGKGIYFIRIKNYGYVGQTIDYNERLGNHIRNAYYGNDNNTSQQLYGKMRIHRIQDLEITLYPEATNFGIPNFEKKYASFLEEGEPVGKHVSKDALITDAKLRMDFAEIYHILYHFIKKDCILTNIEVGGQTPGGTSREKTAMSIVSQSGGKIKLITRQTPPAEAYQTFLRGAVESLPIAKVTEQIYKDLFDANWLTIFKNKYLPLAEEIESSRNIAALFEKAKKLEPWVVFFEKQCLPLIIKNIPIGVEKSFTARGLKTLGAVKNQALIDIAAFVEKNFLGPRQEIAEKMLEGLFLNSGQTPTTTLNILEHFDFTQLGEYIGDLLSQLIIKIGDEQFGLTNKRMAIQIKKGFRPIRFSAVWNTRLHKDASKSSGLLDDLSISMGSLVDKTGLKYRSFLLFDHFMSKRDSMSYRPPKKSESINRYYVPMYELPKEHWLSTEIHKVYKDNAPGYSENGFQFYRPMVSLGRSEHNRPAFQNIRFHEKEYLGYESPVRDMLIVYYDIKNFVDGVTSGDQLTIY